MKIRDIKDPRIQQMAIINAINENPELHLEHIMNYLLKNAFIWAKAPQGSRFWQSVSEMKPFKYSEFGLFFKSTQGIFKQQVDELEFRCANDLATPEEVYNHLKQEDMSNPTYGKNTIYTQEEAKVQKDTSTLQEPQERENTRPLLNGALDKIIILEEEKKDLTSKLDNINDMMSFSNKGFQSKIKELAAQNDKLNKLVDEIEEELTKRAGNVFYPQIDLIELIHNYRNPSLVGTTQTVEIDGKKYEVTVNQQIQ